MPLRITSRSCSDRRSTRQALSFPLSPGRSFNFGPLYACHFPPASCRGELSTQLRRDSRVAVESTRSRAVCLLGGAAGVPHGLWDNPCRATLAGLPGPGRWLPGSEVAQYQDMHWAAGTK